MNEMIFVRNESYARYEEMILRRDNVKKQALQYHNDYIREFGELIVDVFEKKIACIELKKKIEFCQMMINRDGRINMAALETYIQKEMEEFRKNLKEMADEAEAARKATRISEYEFLQIKKIYRKIVKLIHPDINPQTQESEVMMDLWQRVVIAYNCNKLKDLQELEVLVAKVLEQIDGRIEIDIPDIEEKIAELEKEIKEVVSTDPYQFKYILEDPEAIKLKKEELTEELKEYEEYAESLKEIYNNLFESGVVFTWQMN